MAEAPSIKVRLSPEGVAEVIAAFKRVQREAATLSKAGAGISSAMTGLLRLLPAISFAAAAASAVAFTKSVISADAALDDMSEKTGASVEELSKLTQVMRIGGHSIDIVETSLIRLAKALHGGDEEAKGAGAALAALGLKAEELRSMDTAEALRVVAVEMNKYADGSGKTALALALLGRGGAQALPFLKDLANEQGIATRTTAEQAAQAEELGKAFARLVNEIRNLGTALAHDLVPWLSNVLEQLREGTRIAGGFGSAILLLGTINPFRDIAGNVKEYRKELESLEADRARQLRSGPVDVSGIDQAIATTEKKLEFLKFQQRQEALALTEGARGRLDAKDPSTFKPPLKFSSAEAQVKKAGKDTALEAEKARLAFLKSQLDNELALFQAHNNLLESQDRAKFDQGLLSLQEFHTRRLALITAELDKEIATLEGKRALTEQTPTKDEADAERLNRELAQLDTQIRVKRIERDRVAGEATETERKAIEALKKERLQMDIRLLESQGKRTEAALKGLDEEIKRWEEKLRLEGLSEAAIKEKTTEVRGAGERTIGLEDARGRGDLAFRDLAVEREKINQQVARGQLFQFQGEEKIIALEKDRLPVLKAIADEMARLAAGDPFKTQEALEFAAAIAQIEVNVDKAGREMAELQEKTFNALVSNTAEFFSRGIDEAKNFRGAIKSLLFSISQDLRRFAAEALAKSIWESILGKASGAGGSGGFNLSSLASMAAAFFGGGGGFAGGGLVRGPGTGTSDSIPARLSAGEFVMREAAVRNIGVDLLSAMNASRNFSVAKIGRNVPRFAEGGLVGEGGAADWGRLTIGLADGLQVKDSRLDSRALVKTIHHHKRSIRNALGI